MKELGKEARELLDAAAGVNAAPAAVRLRARKRLLSTMAAGSVVTTAAVAKGAWLGTQSGAAAIGTGGTGAIGAGAVGAGTSLAATLVSAMMIGLSTGLVVFSPASQTQAPPRSVIENRVASKQPVVKVPKSRSVVRPEPAPVESSALSEPSTSADLTAPSRPIHGPAPLATMERREQRAFTNPLSPQPEEPYAAAANPDVSESRGTSDGPSAPPPSAAANTSIARETERLAQVQRALKGGRALMAMYLLDQYREEFPSGKLHEEATASRVVALCTLGRTDEARRVKEEFARRYPNSPLAGRVRGACEKSSSRPEPAANE